MEINDALGIEYRVVDEVEHNGQPARVVSGARTYDADSAELWDALTDAERITRWFAPITGDLKLGGRYQLKGNAGGEITRCDPPSALEVTWEYGENVSWVKVRLEPDGKGTRLTLKHLMWKDEASESHWKKYGPGATGVGWELGFLGMGLYLESGRESVVTTEYETWMATDAGKMFVRECASAWGAAHISSGENPDVAVAMAEQTAKAYCGEE